MRRQDGPRRLHIVTRLNGSRVHLTITDTGPGIPPEIREKVFEPFFTTKPAGEGTGLGLSLCRGIIEEHGGTIRVEGEPGQGTTLVIELPVSERSQAAAGVQLVEALPAVGPGRLLVVDDEPDIAGVLREILEQAGHRVDTVDDGAAALKLLGQHAYDLVLSDTKMPGLDGVTLYRELERRFPTLCRRFVFLTGDVLDRDKREFLESTGVPCLMKPFEVQEVRRLVHRILSTQ
jgi:two-component system NtrC family sensor kinase